MRELRRIATFSFSSYFFADQKSAPIDCNYLKLLFCYKGHTDDGQDLDNDHNEGQNHYNSDNIFLTQVLFD